MDIALVFDPFTGTFTSPDALELSVDYTADPSEEDSSTPLAASSAQFSLDLTDSFAAGEQYRTYEQTQNGFEAGRLTDWRVERNGVIEGIFSNGLTRNYRTDCAGRRPQPRRTGSRRKWDFRRDSGLWHPPGL